MSHAEIAEPVSSEAGLGEAGFADLLASLAALRVSPSETSDHGSQQDQLEDDVATLSYESALRAHTRTRGVPGHNSARPAASVGQSMQSQRISAPRPQVAGGASRQAPVPGSQERKCASITIRMSEEDCQQLRDRAAEAGITVSAYLRSCAFEVESLRAQVKQTLAEMRSASPGVKPSERAQSSVRRTDPQETWNTRLRLGRLVPHGIRLGKLWPGKRESRESLRDPLAV